VIMVNERGFILQPKQVIT